MDQLEELLVVEGCHGNLRVRRESSTLDLPPGTEHHRRMRRGIRRALLVLISLLYVLSIPRYRDAGADPGSLWGLPDWVAVALLCYLAAAALNAVAWYLTDIPEPPHDPGDA